jgi:hypothetical protein
MASRPSLLAIWRTWGQGYLLSWLNYKDLYLRFGSIWILALVIKNRKFVGSSQELRVKPKSDNVFLLSTGLSIYTMTRTNWPVCSYQLPDSRTDAGLDRFQYHDRYKASTSGGERRVSRPYCNR